MHRARMARVARSGLPSGARPGARDDRQDLVVANDAEQLAVVHDLDRCGRSEHGASRFAHRTAWPSPGLSLRAILDSLPAAKKFHPAFECNSLRLMASLARRGNCIAFQTPIGIEQELKAGSLVWIALADKRLPADRLHVVRRQGPAGRPAVDAFLGFAAGQISTARTVRK